MKKWLEKKSISQNTVIHNPLCLLCRFGSQLNSLEGYDDDEQDYSDYGMLSDYGDYDQYDDDQFGRQRTFPYMQKFVKKDEETIGELWWGWKELIWKLRDRKVWLA